MSFNKKDLEIIYSLSWKNGPKCANKEMNIIAVYDIPATTLNFEVFKSYLLKNSGTAEDDVKVSYIMDNGKEYPIQSQTDFQVALYAFRRKARLGEVINLMLEKISDRPVHKNLRHSNDVETQFDNNDQSSIVSTTCCNIELPPEWFISSMAQLKKDITEEITATISSVVSAALANLKPQVVHQPACHHYSRKSKPEKRIRKITPHLVENTTDTKDLLKTLRLDNKLERLERKASKYREKRLALHCTAKSSDSEAGHSSSRSRSRDKDENGKEERNAPKMDAKPVNCQSIVPHMLGGEIYLHQWEVMNTGEAAWTSKTHLQYTWGSKSLEPLNKVISVPYLKPGDKGVIAVRLQIPNESGKYECYWQFMHKGRRFGHWLGCQIFVDPFDLKGNRSVLDTSGAAGYCPSAPKRESFEENGKEGAAAYVPNEDLSLKSFEEFLRHGKAAKTSEAGKSAEALASIYKSLQTEKNEHSESVKNITEKLVREVSCKVEQMNLNDTADSDSNSSDFDNQSLLDGYSSSKNSFKDEFVVVPVPRCFVVESQQNSEEKTKTDQNEKKLNPNKTSTPNIKNSVKTEESKSNFDDNNNDGNASGSSGNSIKLRDEDLDNIVVITVPKDEQVKEGFIYVHVDGQKVLIPKNILKSEVVNAAQTMEKLSVENSVGVVLDSNEESIKTPTPSVASTLTRQNSHQSELKQTQQDESGNTVDCLRPIKLARQNQENHGADAEQRKLQQEDGNTAFGWKVNNLTPQQQESNDIPSNYFEAHNYMSHCSAAGSAFSDANGSAERQNRLFIFPQNVPGYEVVYPFGDAEHPTDPVLRCEQPRPTISGDPEPNCFAPGSANPFVDLSYVPNYQQTPLEQRNVPVPTTETTSTNEIPERESHRGVNQGGSNGNPTQVHILPETLVTGAVNVASTAINTARSVINMMKPQAPGRWENGHWVSNSPQTPREANLQALAEMGFWNRDLNATLLARFNDDLNRVVAELVI